MSDHTHSEYTEFDHRHLDQARELDRLDQALTKALERIDRLVARVQIAEQRYDELDRQVAAVEDQAMTSRERLDMLNAPFPPELTEEEQTNPTF